MLQIDLSDKTAVVTGATGQLGRVMAHTLARCGANVAVHYNSNKDKAEEVLEGIRELGAGGMTVQADVTEREPVFEMQKAIKAELGDPHIIVNNAVIQYQWAQVMQQAAEDYEGQFKSCVLHNLHMLHAFVPAMVERKQGRVIAINTECSLQATWTQSAYVAGKRGMDGLLRVFCKEIGEHQITVNQVAPGWTISERDRDEGTEEQKGYQESVPLKRRGTDQEIANVVAFLASDLSSFITGAYIPVCGGNFIPGL